MRLQSISGLLLVQALVLGWVVEIEPAIASDPEAESRSAPSLPATALPVPIVSQATDFSCGPAVLTSILYYWDVYDGGEAALYEPLQTTPKDGTEPAMLAKIAQKEFELEAKVKTNQDIGDLRRALRDGYTTIIDIQAWHEDEKRPKGPIDWKNMWEDGHYVVVVGIDSTYLYVMDPSLHSGYGFIPLRELMDRWHDYEDRTGVIQRNYQLAIYIRGESPAPKFPIPIARVR